MGEGTGKTLARGPVSNRSSTGRAGHLLGARGQHSTGKWKKGVHGEPGTIRGAGARGRDQGPAVTQLTFPSGETNERSSFPSDKFPEKG